MSGINIPPVTASKLEHQCCHGELRRRETFFGTMYVVIAPNTRRRLKRKRSARSGSAKPLVSVG